LITAKERILMAGWRENESLSRALAREGKGIAKGVAKKLLSIATLGLYTPPNVIAKCESDPREDIAGQTGHLAPISR
jgi:hypothetical protein